MFTEKEEEIKVENNNKYKNILIIDDELVNRKVLENQLNLHKFLYNHSHHWLVIYFY